MKIDNKQLVSLFVSSLLILIIGAGLIPLLPVYAESLGADSTISGLYLAFTYLALAMGALSAGKLVGNRLGRKRVLILGFLASIPLTWSLGQARSIWALIFLTALLWFSGGLGMALINIIAGTSAGEFERGKIFGILGLTNALGSIIGGLVSGWLVETWNYTTMFSVMAGLMFLGPISALFINVKASERTHSEDENIEENEPLGRNYWLLFAASIATSIVGYIILLTRSISMNDMGFNPFEITSTFVAGGLISLPIPYLMGSLSDRVERKHVLVVGYLFRIPAIILLAFSMRLWHFWLLSILDGIAVGTSISVGNAYVTDIVSRKAFGRGMAIFGMTTCVSGIVGFALTGVMLENLGLVLSCLLGAGVGLAATMLLLPIRSNQF